MPTDILATIIMAGLAGSASHATAFKRSHQLQSLSVHAEWKKHNQDGTDSMLSKKAVSMYYCRGDGLRTGEVESLSIPISKAVPSAEPVSQCLGTSASSFAALHSLNPRANQDYISIFGQIFCRSSIV